MTHSLSLRAAAAAFASLLLVASCSRSEPSSTAAMPASPSAGRAEQASMSGPRQRIVHVGTTLGVDSVERGAVALRGLTSRYGGYVESGTESATGDGSASFVLRIPASRLGAFRTDLRRLGEVVRDEERVEDVTAQHADLGARLRNARAQEARLQELLATRTGSLADVVAVTNEIGRVRETIERYEAEQRVLDARIAMADVSVSLSPRQVAFWQEPGRSVVEAASFGFHGACAVVVGVTMALVAVGPTALVGLFALIVLIFAARAIFRRRTVVASA